MSISERTWRISKNPRAELGKLLSQFGPDELRVMLRVARRLTVGLERYGQMRLKTDTRDYAKEAMEEILDWLVYSEMDTERKTQKVESKARIKPKKRTKPMKYKILEGTIGD